MSIFHSYCAVRSPAAMAPSPLCGVCYGAGSGTWTACVTVGFEHQHGLVMNDALTIAVRVGASHAISEM